MNNRDRGILAHVSRELARGVGQSRGISMGSSRTKEDADLRGRGESRSDIEQGIGADTGLGVGEDTGAPPADVRDSSAGAGTSLMRVFPHLCSSTSVSADTDIEKESADATGAKGRGKDQGGDGDRGKGKGRGGGEGNERRPTPIPIPIPIPITLSAPSPPPVHRQNTTKSLRASATPSSSTSQWCNRMFVCLLAVLLLWVTSLQLVVDITMGTSRAVR